MESGKNVGILGNTWNLAAGFELECVYRGLLDDSVGGAE